jgi:hypothetical protein
MKAVVALAIGGTIGACSMETPDTFEFICEKDTEHTEHHVGVVDYYFNADSSSWWLKYTTGQEAFYRMAEGETCRISKEQL